LFWLWECDRNKLLLYTTVALALYYNNYIYKEHVWFHTTQEWDGGMKF
jgi:hypothetical protein